MRVKWCFILLSILLMSPGLYGQGDSLITKYRLAFDKINNEIRLNKGTSFKDAVYYCENAYFENGIDQTQFDYSIHQLVTICTGWTKANYNLKYSEEDFANFYVNLSIFKVLKDTVRISLDSSTVRLLPFNYDFDDFAAKGDWSKMFVTKLLRTHKGNCHSLPYLYKIIADELGAKCWLALAPNHIYIKNYSKKDGWYNTELTSGDFPIDAWLTASGYIPLKALQNGLYCDTLSNRQSIALCLLDLAKGYERQTKNYYDGFILQCCDKVLEYHAMNVKAMLLKAETLKRIYEKLKKENNANATNTSYSTMEQLYVKLYDLGYREMPESMYKDWLLSVMQQKDKYNNKAINLK